MIGPAAIGKRAATSDPSGLPRPGGRVGNAADSSAAPTVTVLYHYFYPDDVISARHFDGLCVGLAERGWQVLSRPCNRGCRDESQIYPLDEDWRGVKIRRVWRPRFRQSTNLGRILNAGWLIASWSLTSGGCRPDVLLIGTDPILSVLVAAFWRLTRRGVRIAHWGFDLYPETPVADGMLRSNSLLVRGMKAALRIAYRCCDLIADLGGCMRERLQEYDHGARSATLVPWALVEPSTPPAPDPPTRSELFGDARLALLYSGNFGRAHGYTEFLELAREIRGDSISMCFAVRGNRADQLRREVTTADCNIRFAGFAPESELEKRLGAADIHLVSLRPEWTGVVVPSKFFGSLASGRPVIFAGDRRSAIAQWIQDFGIGWLLTSDTVKDVAEDLRTLSRSPARLTAMQQRCHSVYHEHFSHQRVVDRWDKELRHLLPRRADASS